MNKRERGPDCLNKIDRARLREQKREGQVVGIIKRGQVLGTQERGPRCGNKRERARLCEQMREGHV